MIANRWNVDRESTLVQRIRRPKTSTDHLCTGHDFITKCEEVCFIIFFGFGEEIVNGELVDVNVSGGKGGRVQDGSLAMKLFSLMSCAINFLHRNSENR